MAYTDTNFPTKKALKEALAAGKQITVYQPGGIFDSRIPDNGTVYLEGPHYPKPHTWYAKATMENGIVKKIS
jgi:hypothetical protein